MSNIELRNKKKSVNEELMTLHEMMSNAEDCISSLENAFFYNEPIPLKNCREKVEVIKKEGAELTRTLRERITDNTDLKPYVLIPGHLLRIGENIEKLVELVNRKIMEHILFSDKAVRETTFLLQRLREILRPTSEIILARNKFLSMYIQESNVEVEKSASEYATLHEDRLAKGACLPAASSLYINLLNAIKKIAWHSKEIAIKLGGL